MTAEQFQRLRTNFERLLLADTEERERTLEHLAAEAPAMAAELRKMLAVESDGGSVLDRPVAEAISSGDSYEPGAVLGAYRIEKELGRGGMGIVLSARRADGSFDKRVAIKILRHDHVDRSFLRRFERERQILARLSHPHIASIFDAGTSPGGDPYFVMEFVDGVPLTSYCRNHALSLKQRLELFLQICDAVQYAHRNLTVHRDLKPGNILVTGAGAVKLLDFGIATLMQAEGGRGETALTAQILTPEYASPEQVRNEPITTLSDVFALGILLYELLSGKHPFQPGGRLPHEVMTAVAEEDPRPMSTAANARQLRGELDAIAATALRKEPAWRYPSVEQLADDVGRYLRGEPVLARGSGLGYRSRKFARRYWLPLTATALLILVLAGGIVATMVQARVAEAARTSAERALALAEQERRAAEENQHIADEERSIADTRTKEVIAERQKETERYRELRSLAASVLFDLHDGIRDLAGSTTARRLVVAKVQRQLELLSGESGNDPELKRDLAAAYERMGELRLDPRKPDQASAGAALDAYRHAVELRRSLASATGAIPADRRDLALSLAKIADGEFFAGNTKQALTSYDGAWKLAQSLIRATPQDVATRKMLGTVDERRCAVLLAAGNTAGSLDACKEGIATLASLPEAAHDDVEIQRLIATTHASYANALRLSGHVREAVTEGTAALGALEKLESLAPSNAEYRKLTASAGMILAASLAASGDQAGSLDAFRRSVHAMEVALEIDPSDLNSPLRLGVTLLAFSGRLAKGGDRTSAHQTAQEAMRLLEQTATRPGAGPVEWNEYANALVKSEFPDLADPARALQLAQRAASTTHRSNAFFLDTLAWAYFRSGDRSKAADTEREALRLLPADAKGGLHDELEHGLSTFLHDENL